MKGENMIGTLAGSEVTATEAKYHKDCYMENSNKYRQYISQTQPSLSDFASPVKQQCY